MNGSRCGADALVEIQDIALLRNHSGGYGCKSHWAKVHKFLGSDNMGHFSTTCLYSSKIMKAGLKNGNTQTHKVSYSKADKKEIFIEGQDWRKQSYNSKIQTSHTRGQIPYLLTEHTPLDFLNITLNWVMYYERKFSTFPSSCLLLWTRAVSATNADNDELTLFAWGF